MRWLRVVVVVARGVALWAMAILVLWLMAVVLVLWIVVGTGAARSVRLTVWVVLPGGVWIVVVAVVVWWRFSVRG